MNPDAFVDEGTFARGLAEYLADLRAQPAAEGQRC